MANEEEDGTEDNGELRGFPYVSGAEDEDDNVAVANIVFACCVATICFIIS